MSVQVKPENTFQFGGIVVPGHPLHAPYGSAEHILDIRQFRDGWIRLRGGHVARLNTNGTEFLRLHRVSVSSAYAGINTHLAVGKYASGSAVRLYQLGVAPFAITEGTILETLSTSNITSLATDPTPMVNASQYVVYSNGYGYLTEYNTSGHFVAVPALSAYSTDGRIRFWGLGIRFRVPPFLSGPTVAFAAGAGLNQVLERVILWCGLYNSVTGHYSDGYEMGTITTTGGTGTITVSGIDSVIAPYHDASELAELYVVFYSSIDGDGYTVPYLIVDSVTGEPHKLNIQTITTTFDLSFDADTENGWTLDTTHRIPINNAPPRAMTSVAYVGGRLFGILESNGQVAVGDNIFKISDADKNGVVFSEASGSIQTTDFLGDPLESWPAKNFSRCPTGEIPLLAVTAPDQQKLVVFTASKMFTVREQANNIMEWNTESPEHGIFRDPSGAARCQIATQRGLVYLTQRKQLAIYTIDGAHQLLSYPDFDVQLRTITTVGTMAYIYDPSNGIDRVDIHCNTTAGYRKFSADFEVGFSSNLDIYRVRASATLVDSIGQTYHCLGGSTPSACIVTAEGQPDASYQIRTADEYFTTAGAGTTATAEIGTGVWRSNWIGFNDPNLRKQIDFIDIIGDAATSAQLAAPALVLKYVAGFQAPTGGNMLTPTKVQLSQEPLLQQWRYKIQKPHNTFWKFEVSLISHAQEYGQYYPNPGSEGNFATNFYGSAVSMALTIAETQNRHG